jgi:hypothetical protein
LAQGIEIERSVLAFWVGYAAAELMPLWRRLRDILLGSPRLFVDETRAPVLDPGHSPGGRVASGQAPQTVLTAHRLRKRRRRWRTTLRRARRNSMIAGATSSATFCH